MTRKIINHSKKDFRLATEKKIHPKSVVDEA
ncbi:hypothetical protein BXY57_1915 [Thermoflavifilum aggregans]|uniref:Uncharacterized protein n=1 Tax=Thermoflavifilum aggregans TaxID=454188 RepID=A0A2M9CWP8_9BACT|nr:hypothetical protein BXY57_1915 [Thermoflavifilum aggregans]